MERADSGTATGRIAELDALRGLAALAVLIFHANASWLPCGWAAVDLFFVLSGYLITSIILKNGGARGFLPTFYIRRGLRTWPIYYVTVGLLVALSPILRRPFPWPSLPYVLTYLQGVPRLWSASAPISLYLEHTWTLAVEEQFYLIWPALVLLVGRGPWRVATLAIVCAAASSWTRGHGASVLTLLVTRADGLALGGLLATLPLVPGEGVRGTGGNAVRAALGLTTIASLGVLVVLALRVGLGNRGLWAVPGAMVLAFNLLWTGMIGLVVGHSGHPVLGTLRSRPLRALGRISYGVYLYHLPLLVIVTDFARRDLGLTGKLNGVRLLALVASIALAALSWRFVERPLLALNERFAYRPAPSVPLLAGPHGTGRPASHLFNAVWRRAAPHRRR